MEVVLPEPTVPTNMVFWHKSAPVKSKETGTLGSLRLEVPVNSSLVGAQGKHATMFSKSLNRLFTPHFMENVEYGYRNDLLI